MSHKKYKKSIGSRSCSSDDNGNAWQAAAVEAAAVTTALEQMAAISQRPLAARTASSSTDTGSGEIVPLKWVTIGNGMPANYDSWITKVNEYIGDKVGCQP